MDYHLETSNRFGESEVVNRYSEKNIHGIISTGLPLAEITEGNLNIRGIKRKKNNKKNSNFTREAPHMNQKDVIPVFPSRDRNHGKEMSKPSENNDIQIKNQNKISIDSNDYHAEDTVYIKRKGKKHFKSGIRWKNEAQAIDQENSLSDSQISHKNLGKEIDDRHQENEDAQRINQKKMGTESRNIVTEGKVNEKRKMRKNIKSTAKNKDKVHVTYLANSFSNLQVSDKNLREVFDYQLNKDAQVQSMSQKRMDMESSNDLTEGSANDVRKRRKKTMRLPTNTDEVQDIDWEYSISNLRLSDKIKTDCRLVENVDVQSMNQNKMEMESKSNVAESNANSKSERRKPNKIQTNFKEVQVIDLGESKSKSQLSNKILGVDIESIFAKNEDAHCINQQEMDIEPTNILTENIANGKVKNREKSKTKPRNGDESDKNFGEEVDYKFAKIDEGQSINQIITDIEPRINIAENIVYGKRRKKNKRKETNEGVQTIDLVNSMSKFQLSDESLGIKIDGKSAKNLDDQRCNRQKMDLEPSNNANEEIVNNKLKRRKTKKKTKNVDEVQNVDLASHLPSLQSSAYKSIEYKIDGKLVESEDVQIMNWHERDVRILEYNMLDAESTDNAAAGNVDANTKRKNSKTKATNNNAAGQISEDSMFENLLHEVNESIIDEGKSSHCSSSVKEPRWLLKDFGENISIGPTTGRRKLLVLDVNGLLADILMPPPKDRKGDIRILGREIFKRPFCHDFLKFCFQNFDIGIWSSRAKKTIDGIVDYLLGNLKQKLLFCWDMSHSTQTGFKTLENIHKPLVCKELSKIWASDDPDSPWKKGDYDESNTLLLDDSPYKALLNPPYTAIFPHSYHYKDTKDNSLGPGGDLRIYLEGFLKSNNTKEFIEQHPFGQSVINEMDVSWQFYSQVLQAMSKELTIKSPSQLPAILELEETTAKP